MQVKLSSFGISDHWLHQRMQLYIFDTVIHTHADNVINSTTTPKRILSKRLSQLDNMLAEDIDQIGASPITTDHIQNGNTNSTVSTNAASESRSKFTDTDGIKGEANTKANVSMAIVPHKKKEGRNFLKKLFMWQKKGDRKKKTLLLICNVTMELKNELLFLLYYSSTAYIGGEVLTKA